MPMTCLDCIIPKIETLAIGNWVIIYLTLPKGDDVLNEFVNTIRRKPLQQSLHTAHWDGWNTLLWFKVSPIQIPYHGESNQNCNWKECHSHESKSMSQKSMTIGISPGAIRFSLKKY